jgi:Ca-activated chloride channel family protein
VPAFRSLLATCLVFALTPSPGSAQSVERPEPPPGGRLAIRTAGGQDSLCCPLKHTTVQADAAGLIARTTVTQIFENPLDEKIGATYIFPLPHEAAVDRMTMIVGEKRIVGEIKPREEAARIYEEAIEQGHVAGLLEQERPNVFTQSLANIEPGARISIEISYLAPLDYEDGVAEYVFPMTVGPRYIPVSPDITRVPDARRISPRWVSPETRAGHDVDLTVRIDAGTELFEIESPLHEIEIKRRGSSGATVTLKNRDELLNRDFVLRFRSAADKQIADALFTHSDERGHFFTLLLQPPRQTPPERIAPKELIFVIDRSGSMSGAPIDKSRETMRLCVMGMNPRDTFNVISFSDQVDRLFERPAPNTPENRLAAADYLDALDAGGGTQMLPAIVTALSEEMDPERLRVICFMSDGFVGNDREIVAAVEEFADLARVFSFGVGNSVNRSLLDAMARVGRGDVQFVTLVEPGAEAAARFHQRISAPVLTDVEFEWGDLPVRDVYPERVPDLFSEKPIMVHGRLDEMRPGAVVLNGNSAGGPIRRMIDFELPDESSSNEFVATLWARAKIRRLMTRNAIEVQYGSLADEAKKEIVDLSLQFGLITEFTSFVAVEYERTVADGPLRKVDVPVNLPLGCVERGFGGGATFDPTLWLAGLAAILLGTALWTVRRRYAL